MTATATNNWQEANQNYVMAAVALVREVLEARVKGKKNRRPLSIQLELSASSGIGAAVYHLWLVIF
jgi:hypothetical protein